MEIYLRLIELLSRVPAWIPLIVFPVAALGASLCLALFGGRRFYIPAACAIAACGFALIAAKGELTAAFVYIGAAAVLFVLFSLCFLLPRVRRKRGESRGERIYKKFHEEAERPAADALPPKVCCFEEPATAEESGMRLVYVTSLINRLKGCKLTPADRLELEALGRSVDGCRGRSLTGEELASLNDCLAAVLKLTAKYKL